MNIKIHEYKNIRPQIEQAVDAFVNPIKQTISPKGKNVLFVDDNGNTQSSNDGATIARQINLSDKVQDAIVSLLKQACHKTNVEAGDGTSTTALLAGIATKEGLRLVDSGFNPMDVKKMLASFGNDIVKKLRAKAIKIKGDKDLLNIAKISANSDQEIADNVLKTIKVTGLDGMVFIEANNKIDTEIIEDTGFNVNGGLISPDLRNTEGKMAATYQDIPVLITDKRIYYPEEAETIMSTVLDNGYRSVVVIARDFIGSSIAKFVANHKAGKINVLLVKDRSVSETDSETLTDLATYLGGKVVSEKNGSIVNKLKISDFMLASKVYSDPSKTIISTKLTKNKALKERISLLKREFEKDKDNKQLQKRIASLTNGMVTIKVGASTPVELKEKVYRYEDAISASRAALRDGYLVGGGVSLISVLDDKYLAGLNPQFSVLAKKFCQANVRQIAENCGEHPDSIVETTKGCVGYNAVTGRIEDLLTAGVVDPFKVTEMAVLNSISVAGEIISSNYLFVPDTDGEDD